jgi:hypothetical protein
MPLSITHRDVAEIIAALYGNIAGVTSPTWLYLSNPDANVYMGIVRRPGCLIVGSRGSFNIADWLRDLFARAIIPKGRPELGAVHEGMYDGTPEAHDIFESALMPEDHVIFCGHSLGAARAGFGAGHAIANGLDPRRIFTLCWGEPRWCTDATRKLLAGVPGYSYRNAGPDGHDHVTDVPTFEFQQHAELSDIDGGSRGLEIDLFRRHHFDLYLRATPPVPVVFGDGVSLG